MLTKNRNGEMKKPDNWDNDEGKLMVTEFGIINIQSWNAAIEKAAETIKEQYDHFGDAVIRHYKPMWIEEIRKLKINPACPVCKQAHNPSIDCSGN